MPGRLNVLHAIHDFLPRHRAGSEIYALDLCQELARRHDVTVVCADFDLSRQHGDVDWRVYDGLPVVEIVNNWHGHSFEDTYESPLITERLQHVLNALQPDVLHVHNLLNLSFALPRLARDRGIPVAATLHDYTLVCPSGGQRVHRSENHVCHVIEPERCARCFPESPQATMRTAAMSASRVPAPLWRMSKAVHQAMPSLTGRAVRLARGSSRGGMSPDEISARLEAAKRVMNTFDVIVAPSSSMASEFIAMGAPGERVRVSDYGTRPLRATKSRRDGPLRVGYVGTLAWHKGVHIAIEAMRTLPPDACELLIYGDPAVFPDYTADLKRLAARLPVRFMGGFERTDASTVYGSFDVLVVPSLWLENSPLVIHEAFLSGVPVVGSEIGGIAGLVEDGVSGLLLETGSPAAFAAAFLRLAENPSTLDRLAAGVPPVKTMASDADEWEETYHSLIDGRKHHAI